jgi:hypothetical protein
MKTLIPIAALCLACGCMSIRGRLYSGDGEFKARSNLLGPGYSVTFTSFPADRPYAASYALGSLPSSSQGPSMYLCFRSDAPLPSKAAKAQVTATVHVALEDSSGRTVHSFELPLGEATWMWGSGLYSAYGDQSRLQFEPLLRYVLRVSYAPGTTPPPAKELFFKIDASAIY